MAQSLDITNALGKKVILQNPDTNTSDVTVDIDKIVVKSLSASTIPTTNSTMEFQLTSNTQLTIKVKGSDGVVRSTNITLS